MQRAESLPASGVGVETAAPETSRVGSGVIKVALVSWSFSTSRASSSDPSSRSRSKRAT